MKKTNDIRDLIERLARLHAADSRSAVLNPAQRAALSYLARANMYSRSPSMVADYLNATRGTVSQTIKSLVQKGFVVEERSAMDRRAMSLDLTEEGRAVLSGSSALDAVLRKFPDGTGEELRAGLGELVKAMLKQRGDAPFGICETCRYHMIRDSKRHCELLDVPLSREQGRQICHAYTE